VGFLSPSAELRRSADELRALSRSLSEAGAGLADAEGTGADTTGTVTVTVRADGSIVTLSIAESWRKTIDSSLLGSAVFAAIAAGRSDLEAQWERSSQGDAPVPTGAAHVLTEHFVPRRSAPSAEALAARIDAILNAKAEEGAYVAAVSTGELDSSYPSPAEYFTVRTTSGRVTALEADDYRLTFASAADIADDVRAVFADAAARDSTGDEELDTRFPAIAELKRLRAERD
jgi:DNA-binding protein YbaB